MLKLRMFALIFSSSPSMLVFPLALWSSLIHSPQSIVSDVKYKSYHVSPLLKNIQWLPFPISCRATLLFAQCGQPAWFVQVLRCSVPSPAPGSLHSPFLCLHGSLPPFHHWVTSVCPSELNASSMDCLRNIKPPLTACHNFSFTASVIVSDDLFMVLSNLIFAIYT